MKRFPHICSTINQHSTGTKGQPGRLYEGRRLGCSDIKIHETYNDLTTVAVLNQDLDRAIRVLRQRLIADGVFKRLKDRYDFPTASGRKKIKKTRAERRRKKIKWQTKQK